MTLTVGSLFTGAGGIELGFHRAGLTPIWFCEKDPHAQLRLARHWPGVPCHEDVRGVGAACLARPDVLAGGFPCQPHSASGKQFGDADERDMWPEVVRLVRELEPRFLVVENVARLLTTQGGGFFGSMLADLAALGLDAEWDCLPASAFGAAHERDRVFLVAYRPSLRGDARGVLEAGEDWRASLQSRRVRGVEVARRGQPAGARLDSEPRLDRLVHGVSRGVDRHRLRLAGNAVYPAAAEFVGRMIISANAAWLAA